MSNIYSSILEKLAALNVDIYHYEDIVRCYGFAKLNIEHSQKSDYTDGIHRAEFDVEVSRYQLPSDGKPNYDSAAFFALCSELVSAGMEKDCRLFFEAFAPFLVADWDRLVSIFPKGHHERLAYVLYLILKSTNESQLSFAEIDASTIESFYEGNKELYNSLEITKDTFTHCWQAVYYNHMPELKGTVSPRLVDTIRFYRQHKVSGLQLVANYCQYNKHRTQLKDAFNPWVEFEQAIKGRVNTTEGVSIAESAFNMVGDIRNEKPSDIMKFCLQPHTSANLPTKVLSTKSKKSTLITTPRISWISCLEVECSLLMMRAL